ncbi:MAG: hypothetical protein ACNA7J_13085, partial [Wenzhouxiangella sp.]
MAIFFAVHLRLLARERDLWRVRFGNASIGRPIGVGNGTMKMMSTALRGLGWIVLGILSMAAVAGPEPSGCEDLSGIGEVPDVDYSQQIQPIFDASCVGCHGDGGGLS